MNSINKNVFNNAMKGAAEFINMSNDYITIFLAFVLITLIILFVYHAASLSRAGDNVVKRQSAIHGLLVIGVCLAIAGSFWCIYGIVLGFLLL